MEKKFFIFCLGINDTDIKGVAAKSSKILFRIVEESSRRLRFLR